MQYPSISLSVSLSLWISHEKFGTFFAPGVLSGGQLTHRSWQILLENMLSQMKTVLFSWRRKKKKKLSRNLNPKKTCARSSSAFHEQNVLCVLQTSWYNCKSAFCYKMCMCNISNTYFQMINNKWVNKYGEAALLIMGSSLFQDVLSLLLDPY